MSGAWVHFEVDEVVRETDKAILIRLENGWEGWVPKSVTDDPDRLATGDADVTLTVRSWWAEKEGLEGGS